MEHERKQTDLFPNLKIKCLARTNFLLNADKIKAVNGYFKSFNNSGKILKSIGLNANEYIPFQNDAFLRLALKTFRFNLVDI